jgi:hypothetical protein
MKIQVSLQCDNGNRNSDEGSCTVMTECVSSPLRIINVFNQNCTANEDTFYVKHFFSENHDIYETVQKIM